MHFIRVGNYAKQQYLSFHIEILKLEDLALKCAIRDSAFSCDKATGRTWEQKLTPDWIIYCFKITAKTKFDSSCEN